jgi:hypothetical protein
MNGAAGSVSVEEFTRVCDQVDAEAAAALSGVFAQHRTWGKAAAYVEALCRDDVAVKTCWDLSQAAGLTRPGPFQALIGENEWDHRELWEGIAGWASRVLTCPADDRLGPGIAVDETAQAKRGRHTAGVGVQYAGFAGATINCVTSVVASLVTPGASTWVANELFLQEKQWFTGQGAKGLARRVAAGVGDQVQFASKPQIARRELAHLRALGVAFTWAAGDEVYGRSSALRKDHEDHHEAYAYFVPRDYQFPLPGGTPVRADEMLQHADGHFEARSCGPGLYGPRWYQWAMLATASPEHFLLVRAAAAEPPPPALAGTSPNSGDHHGAEPGTGHGDGATSDPRTADLPPGTGFPKPVQRPRCQQAPRFATTNPHLCRERLNYCGRATSRHPKGDRDRSGTESARLRDILWGTQAVHEGLFHLVFRQVRSTEFLGQSPCKRRLP